MELEQIREIAKTVADKFDCFLVEATISKNQEICIIVDNDSSVSIDTCSEISRNIEMAMDRDKEDFELTVMSAGIGEPLKLQRQYKKLITKPISIVKVDGTKILATLDEVREDGISVSYDEKVLHASEKRKRLEHISLSIPFDDIKKATEHIDFK